MVVLDILRGFLGLAFLIGTCYVLSANRKAIDWALVIKGVLGQLVIAVLVLKVPFIAGIFSWLAGAFTKVLGCSSAGAEFLFGNLTKVDSMGFIFAFQVLPTIVFFSALSSALYYLGILQFVVKGFAWIMTRTLKLSGAESLAAAANIFMGQTEAPLVVKPYVKNMTKSELLCLMTGGMATIAGSVFAAYVLFLGGTDPVLQQKFATHLLTASIMSAPAAIVAAKMLYPEVEREKLDTSVDIPRENIGSNFLEALSNGTSDGLKLAVNVAAMLMAFTALIFLLNKFLMLGGTIGNINGFIAESTGGRFQGLSFQYIMGLMGAPIAWLLGTDWNDCLVVGQLLGEKTAINEFVAYADLEKLKGGMSEKSLLISTYALCGFSNFASIGIQIGGIGALAPERKADLAAFGIKALIGGTVACFMTGAIAGMLANAIG